MPENADEDSMTMTLLFKQGTETPATGVYDMGEYYYGQDIPAENFGQNFHNKTAIKR